MKTEMYEDGEVWTVSSAVERCVHIAEVTGSSPVPSTKQDCKFLEEKQKLPFK